jgi:hypothetical protein
MQRVEALKAIQPDRYELWKYYEDRADSLGERMWSVGIYPNQCYAVTSIRRRTHQDGPGFSVPKD